MERDAVFPPIRGACLTFAIGASVEQRTSICPLREVTDIANDEKDKAAFDNFVQLWTTGTTAGRRAPVLRRPDEVGLDYEDVFFPSMDGVPLGGSSRPTQTG